MTTGSVDKLFARYIRTADAAALAEVFDRSSAEILRVARHFARDEAEAEDLLQDTFLRGIERAETFRIGERVVPWLLGILVNEARARFRRRRDGTELEHEAVATEDPAQQAQDREVNSQILRALTGIPQPYRDVLERHLEHGHNGSQISRDLGRSANTVRSQLRRGLGLLRAALPAGFAVACQPAQTRGLGAIRDVVITRASASAGAVSSSVSWFGVWWMSKKLMFVGSAALLLAAAWWVIDPFEATDPDVLGGAGIELATVDGRVDRTNSTTEGEAPAERTAVEPGAEELPPDTRYAAALAGFSGRIVDAERRPVVGATVDLYRIDPSTLLAGADPRTEFVIATTESGSDGRFALSDVPVRGMFLLRATHPQGDRLQVVEQSPGPGDRIDLGTLELTPPTSIRGRIVGPDNEPIHGAAVRAIDMPPLTLSVFGVPHFDPERSKIIVRGAGGRVVEIPAWARRFVSEFGFRTTRSDIDGQFELHGVQPGSNALIVRAPTLAVEVRASTRARKGEVTDVGTLRLREGEEAMVRVLDHDGHPIVDAEVLIAPAGRSLPIEFAAPAPNTDRQGNTSLEGLPMGSITVAVRRDPGHRWTIADPVPVQQDVVVRLPTARALDLTVQDAQSGLPVTGATLRISGGTTAEFNLFETTWLSIGPSSTDATGHLSVAGLDAGTYTIEVSAPGYAAHHANADLTTDLTTRVALTPTTPTKILVVDGSGSPVSFARVIAASDPNSDAVRLVATTDATGSCELQGLAGAVRVHARHPAFGIGMVRTTWPTATTRITLPAPGAIEATIEPMPARDAPRPRFHIEPTGTNNADETFRTAIADQDGRFVVHGLTPGNYRIRPMPSLANIRSLGSALQHFMLAGTIEDDPVHLVRPAATTRVVIRAPTDSGTTGTPISTLRGTVLIDGLPNGDCRVLTFHRGLDTSAVDENGRFELPDLVMTEIKIAVVLPATHGQTILFRKTIPLDGSDRDLRIEIATGSIAGRLVSTGGAPVAGVGIAANGKLSTDPEAATSTDTQTDANGNFEFVGVPAGTYRLTVFTKQGSADLAQDVVVHAGGRINGLELRMP